MASVSLRAHRRAKRAGVVAPKPMWLLAVERREAHRKQATRSQQVHVSQRAERRATWRIMRGAQPAGTHADRTWAWRQLWPMMSHDYRMALAVEIDRALRAAAKGQR
jgi:hypothetical protein